MPDVIQLLSDHIANQIAAGEVVQRPASAVKELMENSIDAGATEIQLIIKDAGKELIQVADNGKGMSPTDARMAFERHATSKIRTIDDLFRIRTMGFRGEALASVAAVAQVEMRTRQADTEMGTRIVIEGTEVKLQEPFAVNPGTNLMVKNLFFNVPARRHFLKSTTTEYRHILDEFTRIALAYPAIAFRLFNNGSEQFHLDAGNLKTRIVGLLGGTVEKNLVPVEQQTDLLTINGFVGKPETANRTRGNQFFFINGRFVRNAYMHHAVMSAYDSLVEKDTFPFYVLFLELDPAKVDVNVHPTKQEVKFDDDRLIYSHLQAAIRHALARYNIAPSLDFTLSTEITQLPAVSLPVSHTDISGAQTGYLQQVFKSGHQAHVIERRDSLKQWKELYEIAKNPATRDLEPDAILPQPRVQATLLTPGRPEESAQPASNKLLIHGTMLATTVKSGMMLIQVSRAYERIWFERLLAQFNNADGVSQQILFPPTYSFAPQDALLLREVLPDLRRVGFEIVSSGTDGFTVQGVPSGISSGEEKEIMEDVLEYLKHESTDAVGKRMEFVLARVAARLARSRPPITQPEAQQALIDELFGSTRPEYTPDGKKVFVIIKKEALEDMLGQ